VALFVHAPAGEPQRLLHPVARRAGGAVERHAERRHPAVRREHEVLAAVLPLRPDLAQEVERQPVGRAHGLRLGGAEGAARDDGLAGAAGPAGRSWQAARRSAAAAAARRACGGAPHAARC
jgi:hypothetical protein